MLRLTLALLTVSSFLAGCGGGGGGGGSGPGGGGPAPFDCVPIGGGSATTQTFCVSCPGNAVQDRNASIDRDFDSGALLTLYNPDDTAAAQGQLSLRGIAQSGVVFAAGDRAGLVIRMPQASNIAFTATVTTYLADTPQDVRNIATDTTYSGELVYLGFDSTVPTTKQFDSVEYSFTETAPGLEEHVFTVYEFCSDGAA